MILFLDFEGVLHAADNREMTLKKLPLLEAWLQRHPEVNLVISSDWRHHMTIEELSGLFSTDLQDRVLGVTPSAKYDAKDEHQRMAEIFEWLKYCNSETEWLALDSGKFPQKLTRVVNCDAQHGLTHRDLESLTAIKQQLQTKQAIAVDY